MAFAQLTYRESLRDIEACLGAIGPRLSPLGICSTVARSTVVDASENSDWRTFADCAQVLIRAAIKLYANDAGLMHWRRQTHWSRRAIAAQPVPREIVED